MPQSPIVHCKTFCPIVSQRKPSFDAPWVSLGNFCKSVVVKVATPSKALDEKAVFQCASGSLYEMGELIRATRLGSIHRIHRLVCASSGARDHYVRSAEALAVKTYNKRALQETSSKDLEEDPLQEMAWLSFFASTASHPNIISALEIFCDATSYHMVMPFINGGDLLDVLSASGGLQRFSCRQARKLLSDLIPALSHLHAHGVVHRDLSIENILYDKDKDQYVLIDLGLCLQLPEPDKSGKRKCIPRRGITGKRNYIAPEIWSQVDWYDPIACDIWAIGVILFMVLTAAAPMEQARSSDAHYTAITDNRLLDVFRIAYYSAEPMDEHDDMMDVLDDELLLAVDLMQKILRRDPRQRLSLAEILAHPWMKYTPSAL